MNEFDRGFKSISKYGTEIPKHRITKQLCNTRKQLRCYFVPRFKGNSVDLFCLSIRLSEHKRFHCWCKACARTFLSTQLKGCHLVWCTHNNQMFSFAVTAIRSFRDVFIFRICRFSPELREHCSMWFLKSALCINYLNAIPFQHTIYAEFQLIRHMHTIRILFTGTAAQFTIFFFFFSHVQPPRVHSDSKCLMFIFIGILLGVWVLCCAAQIQCLHSVCCQWNNTIVWLRIEHIFVCKIDEKHSHRLIRCMLAHGNLDRIT